MTAPKLIFASPIGQTAVLAVFDQPMREIAVDAPEDARNPANWTPGGGLPSIASVVRNSLFEFELQLASPAPLAAGYTITVSDTVESANAEAMDLTATTQTFSITVPDTTITTITWINQSQFDIVFSSALVPITYNQFSDVVSVQPIDGGRQVQIIGLDTSGAVFRVTLSTPGTAGGSYQVALTRELFVSQATGVVLKAGQEQQLVFGQGSQASIVSASATETSLQATFSEALNYGLLDPLPGLPLFLGAYNTDQGLLGSEVKLGLLPSILQFPQASLPTATINWSVARTRRAVIAGQSFTTQASSVVGSGTEAVGVGTTTLSKTAGSPYEVVFSGGVDSLVRTGRQLTTTMAIAFPPSVTSYPLVVFTLLNTQMSVVVSKTTNNLATVRIYRGSAPVGQESAAFDPSVPFSFSILDACNDNNGFVAVVIDGVVLAGAPAGLVLDSLLTNANAGVTALALTLGSPLSPTETFSVQFSSDLTVDAYLTTGLRGQDSRDLLSFNGSQTAIVVGAAPSPPSPGFQNTGKAAFGVHAEYLSTVDAIQVVIGLNEKAQQTEFSGSVSMLTGQQDIIDQALIDNTTVLVGGNEVIVVFLHPKIWSGVQVGVALDIGSETYSVLVPVACLGAPPILGQMTQQPASWYHQRLPTLPAGANAYGPAFVIHHG